MERVLAMRQMRGRRLLSSLTQRGAIVHCHPYRDQVRAAHGSSGEQGLPLNGALDDPHSSRVAATSSYTTQIPIHESRDGGGAPSHTGPANRPRARHPAQTAAELRRLLPDIPHGLPESAAFAIERSCSVGEKEWLAALLPDLERHARASAYLPEKDAWWSSPAHYALAEVVRRQPYSTSLAMIMEHGYFFLFEREIFLAPDVPLPHILYEDMMRARTFASIQDVPEQQFHLSTDILVALLTLAAYHCTLDKHYFTSADTLLFRKIEQQQRVNGEVLSAYVAVCSAAGRMEKAIATAELMTSQGFVFSKKVFAAMLHPTLSPAQRMMGIAPQAAKGTLLQERLCESLSTSFSPTAVAVHAMFVQCALTLRHVDKWDIVRIAFRDLARSHAGGAPSASAVAVVGGQLVLSPRTAQLMVETFAREKGVRCGPETVKAMLAMLLSASDAAGPHTAEAVDALFVLLRARQNEATELYSTQLALPAVSFTAVEAEALLARVPAPATPVSRLLRSATAALLDAEESQTARVRGATTAPTDEVWRPQGWRREARLKEVLRRLGEAARGGTEPVTAAASGLSHPPTSVGLGLAGGGSEREEESPTTSAHSSDTTSAAGLHVLRSDPSDARDGGVVGWEELRTALARLRELDALGGSSRRRGARTAAGHRVALQLLETREAERRALGEQMLARYMEEAGAPPQATPSPESPTASAVEVDTTAGCRAWAVRVAREEAERASLQRELAEGVAKFL